jgi:HAD superfamily hydrolase (TIGR01549 family)
VLRAVTFDFWRTLIWELPGSLERIRVEHWLHLLTCHGYDVTETRLSEAHGFAFGRASAAWRRNEQYRVDRATTDMLEHLGLSVSDEMQDGLVEAFSVAGLETPLETAPGVCEALTSLRAAGLRIGIVCDVGLTPSPVLREHLRRRGMLHLFDHWSFSDEVGAYKPDVRPFEHACAGLDTRPQETAHVGDQRRTDIAGAIAAGMIPVRYKGVFDDLDESQPEATLIVADHRRLARTLEVSRRI